MNNKIKINKHNKNNKIYLIIKICKTNIISKI